MSTGEVIVAGILGFFVTVAYLAILSDMLAQKRYERRKGEDNG